MVLKDHADGALLLGAAPDQMEKLDSVVTVSPYVILKPTQKLSYLA